jgi:hypothetical protein
VTFRRLSWPLAGLLLLAFAPRARAYDPATTHAGLTERAVLASSLHRVLTRRLGRPLGLLEPLQIHSRYLDPSLRKALWARLGALDPAGGYKPSTDGSSPAMAWVVAGSVLAKTPPERGRHHFLDPRTKRGLDDGPGLSGFAHELRLSFDEGANVREMATGSAFDLTGHSSLEWIHSPANDAGLPALLDHLERAGSGAEAGERESALVRALLALGGMAAVLADAGEPAHVRNDFRGAFLRGQSGARYDEGNTYERYVAARYGRGGLPPFNPTVRRPTVESYFTAPDGEGLADRTNRRFFSPGTRPADPPVDPAMTTRDVLRVVRDSLTYPQPTIPELQLKELGDSRYLTLEGRRALGYVRVPGRVRFFLDDAVHADTARALLPEVGAYVTGLLDHLLRAGLQVQVASGEATITVDGASPPAGQGKLRVFAEDASGIRREIASAAPPASGQAVTVAVPTGAKKVAAVLRGQDAGGPFVAIGEATTVE